MPDRLLRERHKRVLVVLFIPSIERDGQTAIDQDRWVGEALDMLGRVFGGATAYPRAKGVWRDDERQGTLVFDEPIVIHCYTTSTDIEDDHHLAELGAFCRRMGRQTNQGGGGADHCGRVHCHQGLCRGVNR